ncbi:MAG: tRNA (adenosine(37)-N6)-dimethylallyltransferase MiaA [Butyrivibrio sp.]|jgi:tRNA dimethylallyltransferase|nr:tRNA (adenosine(37)-N6)-dimethylallyltransferase MiaA [Butyrivibrio sp.]
MMNKLIILTGPTAVGKTKLSIALAKEIGGEIISADSMQVYRHMNIGTDKITEEAMDGVPHHMIDILEPTQEFNVCIFQHMVQELITGIYERGHIPIIVGGTGFYIQAVLYGINFTQTDSDETLRRSLEQEALEKGTEVLHERLQLIDPASANAIHANNVKRVIRAIEFYEKTGLRISEHNEEEHARSSAYDFRYFVLTDQREVLYARIDARVDQMIENGLENEVRNLKTMGVTKEMTSMQGLGYREMLGYLDGEYDLERAVYLIKRNTRHFAKRQLTWFRRERDVIWIDKSACDRDEQRILQQLLERCAVNE